MRRFENLGCGEKTAVVEGTIRVRKLARAAAGRASPAEPCAVFCLLHFKVGRARASVRKSEKGRARARAKGQE
jgi:hypothetical protein